MARHEVAFGLEACREAARRRSPIASSFETTSQAGGVQTSSIWWRRTSAPARHRYELTSMPAYLAFGRGDAKMTEKRLIRAIPSVSDRFHVAIIFVRWCHAMPGKVGRTGHFESRQRLTMECRAKDQVMIGFPEAVETNCSDWTRRIGSARPSLPGPFSAAAQCSSAVVTGTRLEAAHGTKLCARPVIIPRLNRLMT